MSHSKLEIVTLNCWGIPGPWPIGSKDRVERIDFIAKYLLNNSFDIVALQEVWSTDDYEIMKVKVAPVLPYAHYFYSGFLGSGVCIFSKGKILEVLVHRYSLNGYAHHVHRGDWFGGKVVGLTRLQFGNIARRVNLYSTHCHAEYNRANDAYLPHRLVQALELSQFVKATSLEDDFVFVAGDLNLDPTDLGYKLIITNANLLDSWLNRPPGSANETEEGGFTSEALSNCYTIAGATPKRIDYILFKQNSSFILSVDECQVTMGRIPGRSPPLNFSDHEAVYAKFSIKPRDKNIFPLNKSVSNEINRLQVLMESVALMDKGIGDVRYNRYFFTFCAISLVFLLILTLNFEINYPVVVFIILALCTRFFVTLAIGFCLWFGIIVLKTEENAFLEAKEEVNIILRNEE